MSDPEFYTDDIPVSDLQMHIPNLLARDTPRYLVEYGVRSDDGAMVFHFYPPKQVDDWGPEWPAGESIKSAIDAVFNTSRVSADYVTEMKSFCVVVGSLGHAPDPWVVVAKFFDLLDAGVPSVEA